jgi:hypothetical protein
VGKVEIEIKTIGKTIGYLMSAHEASREPFVRKKIERAITELCRTIEATDKVYEEIVEGILETGIPLQLINGISSCLPGEPMIAEIAGIVEGGFFIKGSHTKTLIGLNEPGKKLIEKMVSAVKRRANERADKQKHLEKGSNKINQRGK